MFNLNFNHNFNQTYINIKPQPKVLFIKQLFSNNKSYHNTKHTRLCASRKNFTLIVWSFSRVSSNSSDSLFVGSSICWDCVWETVPLARSWGVALGAGSNSGAACPRPAGREGGCTQRLCRWRYNLRRCWC